MTGKQDYEAKTIRRIEALINKNPNKPYLKGFRGYLSETSYNSLYTYMGYVVNFIDFCKKENIKELTIDDYSDYLYSLRDKTPSYQCAVYGALKRFSEYLYASDRTEKDYMKYIKRPKSIETQKTKEKRENNYLTSEEIKVYINNIKSGITATGYVPNDEWCTRDLVIVLTFLTTGMRCSALFKLDIDDINLNNRTITITDKGSKVITYYITDEMAEAITDWYYYRNSLVDANERAFIISDHRKRMGQSGIARVIQKYGINIKGKKLSPHKLRATYGTQLYNATKDIVFVQKAMNHSNSHTTELYIRGKNDEAKQMAADIMSKLTFS